MRKPLTFLYALLSVACAGYYGLIGISARFGLSMSAFWLLAAAAFAVAALLNGSKKASNKFRKILLSAFSVLLCVFLALSGLVVSEMRACPQGDVDYLILLGARVEKDGPSPALRRRLNAALEYLSEHPNAVVIASGGQGADEPMSEAECIRNELIQAGIPEAQILLEDQSTTTEENLRFSMRLMKSPNASAAIITNNYHVWRAVHLAEAMGYTNVCGLAAKYTGHTLFHYITREAVCIVVEFLRGNLST